MNIIIAPKDSIIKLSNGNINLKSDTVKKPKPNIINPMPESIILIPLKLCLNLRNENAIPKNIVI